MRYLHLPHEPAPLAIDGPMHVLTIISSVPTLPPLDVEHEWSVLSAALDQEIAAGRVRLDGLAQPTMRALQEWPAEHEVHVLHFIGHGGFDAGQQDGRADDDRRRRAGMRVNSSVLGPHVRDHASLRLVVLNACLSGRADSVDPFSGVAQGLVLQGAAAVVAMQFPITDGASISPNLYGAIVQGIPVDQALTIARKGLQSGFSTEWATPVLFMRS